MLNEEQVQYIKNLRVNYPGLSDSEIKKPLTEASWTADQIEEGIKRYNGTFTPSHLPSAPPAVTEHPGSVLGNFGNKGHITTPTGIIMEDVVANSSPAKPLWKNVTVVVGACLLIGGVGVSIFILKIHERLFDMLLTRA